MKDESRLRPITSRQNALVKDLRKAFHQGEPTADGSVAIEGVRIIEEAIRSGLKFQAVFFSENSRSLATRLLPQIAANTETLELPEDILLSAVSTETPQGVAALVKLKPATLDGLMESVNDSFFLIAVGAARFAGYADLLRSGNDLRASGHLEPCSDIA